MQLDIFTCELNFKCEKKNWTGHIFSHMKEHVKISHADYKLSCVFHVENKNWHMPFFFLHV